MNLYEKLNRLDDSLVESKRVVKKKTLTESTENSKLNMKSNIEEIVFNEFESGHLFADDYESFKTLMRDEGLRATPRAYSYYQELHELGPAGFYDEFKDKFEFDPMFIDEYANIDDNIDETDYIESVKGFKLYDNVVTETGHKGFIIKFLYTDQDDPVAEIKRDWMDSSPIRSYVSKLKHVDNIDEKLTKSVKDVNKRKKFLKDVFTKWEILDLAEAHDDFTGRTYKEAFNYVLNNWDNFYFEDEYEAFCEEELNDDIDEMLTEGSYDPYRAGKFGDRIFNILDRCSGDAIITFMNEYSWPFYESGDSMSDVYDKINNYLDTHSGYGLWSDLDKYFN